MNESCVTDSTSLSKTASEVERTKQVTVVGWVAVGCAVVACITLNEQPTWPVAFGIAALATLMTIICCVILRRN